jgi:hypothetical protein
MSWNRCDVCGRFISLNAFVAGKAERRLIYPASELTCETWETLCEAHRETRTKPYSRNCMARDIPGATCQSPNCDC